MRWVPAGLFGAVACLGGLAFGAVPLESLGRDELASMTAYTVLLAAYGGVLVLLPASALAWVFHWIGMRATAAEWHAMIDLGADRRTIVREASRDGLRRAAIWAGVGAIAGFTLGLVLPYYRPAGVALGPEPSLYALGGLLLTYLVTLAAAWLVAWLAARSLTGARAAGSSRDDAGVGRPREPGRDVGRVLAFQLVAFGVSATIMVADRLFGIGPETVYNSGDVWIINSLAVTGFICIISGLALAARAIAALTRALALRLARGLERGTTKGGRAIATSAQIAADGLAHRSGARSLAIGAMGAVMAITALSSTTSSLDDARAETSGRLALEYTLASTDWWDDMAAPSGAVNEPLDTAVVEALMSDTRVSAVPYGVIRDDSWQWTEELPDGSVTEHTTRSTVLVVNPSDLDVRSAAGARPLGLQDGTATSTPAALTWENGTFGGGRDDLYVLPNSNTTPMVTRPWAEAAYGTIPIVGVMLWPADAGDIAGAPQTGLNSGMIEIAVTDEEIALLDEVVADAGAASLPAMSVSTNETYGFLTYGSAFVGLLTVLAMPLAVTGLILTVTLAVATVKDRRRDYATLAALGAAPRALRLAPALESGLTVIAATVVGVPLGTALGLAVSHPTLLAEGAPLDPVETTWGFTWELAHASWALPVLVAAAALGACVAAAAVLGMFMSRGTPVEELRTADKEGLR